MDRGLEPGLAESQEASAYCGPPSVARMSPDRERGPGVREGECVYCRPPPPVRIDGGLEPEIAESQEASVHCKLSPLALLPRNPAQGSGACEEASVCWRL